jgi:hypothetical protein
MLKYCFSLNLCVLEVKLVQNLAAGRCSFDIRCLSRNNKTVCDVVGVVNDKIGPIACGPLQEGLKKMCGEKKISLCSSQCTEQWKGTHKFLFWGLKEPPYGHLRTYISWEYLFNIRYVGREGPCARLNSNIIMLVLNFYP